MTKKFTQRLSVLLGRSPGPDPRNPFSDALWWRAAVVLLVAIIAIKLITTAW